ncbi:MarR family winged helix-turn-helix transcriptional regulator [Paenibacillus caui]|uniref:MarR family winged helix-turn-helix transcriptional regulator n=1 Tax=Paenibacillus caui TaxID=2873927 RepID=UPI001CA83E8B|nr:MarR family transcriptional regulator [Paenibacillus caui]
MIKNNAASMISKIRDAANQVIVTELHKHGVDNIVPSHGDILTFLYQQDGLSVKELAHKIRRKQPTVTVLVDKLVKLGYVQRTKMEEDTRVTRVMLTEKGRQLEPVFREVSDKLNKTLYGGLDNTEQEQLEALLDRILRSF